MVMMPEPLFAAVEAVEPPRPLFLLSAERPPLRPSDRRASSRPVRDSRCCADATKASTSGSPTTSATSELSVGDYVLAGGEAAALVVIEAVARLVPGVMGNEESAADESFAAGRLEYPQYTRPAEFRGWAVPEVLRSGDHARVVRWRHGAGAAPDTGIAGPTCSRPTRSPRPSEAALDEFPPEEPAG